MRGGTDISALSGFAMPVMSVGDFVDTRAEKVKQMQVFAAITAPDGRKRSSVHPPSS